MSEIKMDLVEAIADLLPKLDDFNRGRLVGLAEGLASTTDATDKKPPSGS